VPTFTCAQCGMEFQVDQELAGESGHCPRCQQPLVAPASGISVMSAASAGPGKTVGAGTVGLEPPTLEAENGKKASRYVFEGEIARGGMGAVVRAIDSGIRREVAVKYLLDQASASKRLRFIEEAQITGQLEHPNIVPIHELGSDEKGRLHFSMKMVKGRTLANMLQGLRETDSAEYPLGRLLTILVNVCNALAYAHARSVIHRDLKPANIMVGDFGEVYVMDWGLAKVRNQGSGVRNQESAVKNESPPQVMTDRLLEAEMTQDGAILGTPVYMAPEQAAGKVDGVDQRSDIYALGAILYEMLTLHGPVDRGGGRAEILRRVVQGEIVPPQARLRGAGSRRRIPPELGAMTMKALATEPARRYPTVETFRQDLERYLEGRSVSAREDSKREQLVKFIKRNKGLSAGIAAIFLVLALGLVFIAQALVAMNEAYAAYQQEQDENSELDRKTVPTLLQAARLLVNEKQFADALGQVELALSFDANVAEARLLHAQLLLGEQRYAEAQEELAAYTKLSPGQDQAIRLLAQGATGNHPGKLLAIADEMARQKAFALADRITQHAENLLADYKKHVETICPGGARRLILNDAGLHLNLADVGKVKDLKPLAGIPLTTLNLSNPDPKPAYELSDLSPLKGMPLTELYLQHAANVRSLAPLAGMPLKILNLHHVALVTDISPIKDLPLEDLQMWGCYSLTDVTPLKSLKLNNLFLPACAREKDLLLLKDMPLTSFGMQSPDIQDLTALAGLKLKHLGLGGSEKVRDLTPIKNMPLTTLSLWLTDVQDLTPLEGMKLRQITFTPKKITRGIDVLRKMKSLEVIGISWEGKLVWPAAVFWKKYDAGEFRK